MKFKWMVVMLVQISLTTGSGEMLSNQPVKSDSRKPNPGSIDAIKSIQVYSIALHTASTPCTYFRFKIFNKISSANSITL